MNATTFIDAISATWAALRPTAGLINPYTIRQIRQSVYFSPGDGTHFQCRHAART